MSRFSAAALDLSRIDKSSLFEPLSFETIRQGRIDDLRTRLEAAGMEWDTFSLEDDSNIQLQETGALRELSTRQAIRDATLDVLLAFSSGAMLDRLGDLHGTTRDTVVPALGATPAVLESDDRYRARIQLALEAMGGAGTAGGYIYHAVSASHAVRDVGLTVLGRGTPNVTVELVVMSADGNGEPSEHLVDAVKARVLAKDVKMLTDVVIVRRAVAVPYGVSATLRVQPGPDPNVIRQAALTSVQAMAESAAYKRIGGGVPHSALVAALHVPGVDSVVNVRPAGDVATQRHQFALLTATSIDVEVIRG